MGRPAALLHLCPNITTYYRLETCVDYRAVFGQRMTHRKLIHTQSSARPREGCQMSLPWSQLQIYLERLS